MVAPVIIGEPGDQHLKLAWVATSGTGTFFGLSWPV